MELTKTYYMFMRISLDGLNETHNNIRCKNDAYEKTVQSLTILKDYKNVSTAISTAVMRENFNEINNFQKYINTTFPSFLKQYDLVFPIEDEKQLKSSFTINDLDYIYDKCPFIFDIPKISIKRKYRCSGGITSAAIDSSKYLKICIAAQDPQFYLGSLDKNNLYEIWRFPNSNGKKFRKEGPHDSKQCKQCNINKECNIVNCKLLAYQYTKNAENPNPITCFIERKHINA